MGSSLILFIEKCGVKMKFVFDIDKKKYDDFVKNNVHKSHFLQSYAWGEFQEKTSDRIAHYVGVEKGGKLLCAALLLEKKLYLSYSYFYAPRGFVIDFFDVELLSFFTKELKGYLKRNNGIFLKLDPDFIIDKHDYKDQQVRIDYDWKLVFNSLKSLGYKHQGFTKNFETAQPRYSFRIDLKQSKEDVLDHFSKTTKKRIGKSEGFEPEIVIGKKSDIKNFYELMRSTERRKAFVSYDYEHYLKLFEVYGKDNEIKLFLAYIYPEKVIAKYQEKADELSSKKKAFDESGKYKQSKYDELVRQLEESLNYIKEYEIALKTYGKKILLNAHVIIFYGNKAWALYAGNHEALVDAGTNYQLYREHISYSQEKGYDIYDNFGAVGNLDKSNHLSGLYIMKKSFGGDYIEFLGEFDLITNKFMYFVFKSLIGSYRKIKKKLLKRRLKNEDN